ncbi:hypothetical protein SAMN06265365_102272 [Tistlia consotensis]|uniref:DUF2218 domain-containing protein n=1 Tax=Tistlia consotensis USBA 355 TaxID=560819 RepID=A0A1Y6BFF3_9PROT|nr:DUF2218 domain-containing protein [Tistlia consotensis]SMF07214.1 hypothetical protein SAMN05428998_10444 [Tistlia consotensis USBA 355]SNR36019.1 hypothetical protein SAMN06265365_102272 [Tistlia consotensis]
MTRFEASVPTAHASRYLQQLCKHWSHRFEVTFDATSGEVRMTGATCRFEAAPERLSLYLEGEDAAALPRLCGVVADHLKRFAFREDLAVEWREAA